MGGDIVMKLGIKYFMTRNRRICTRNMVGDIVRKLRVRHEIYVGIGIGVYVNDIYVIKYVYK